MNLICSPCCTTWGKIGLSLVKFISLHGRFTEGNTRPLFRRTVTVCLIILLLDPRATKEETNSDLTQDNHTELRQDRLRVNVFGVNIYFRLISLNFQSPFRLYIGHNSCHRSSSATIVPRTFVRRQFLTEIKLITSSFFLEQT